MTQLKDAFGANINPTTTSDNVVVGSSTLTTILNTKQNTISGGNGEVAYSNGSSIFTQQISSFTMVCSTQAEVDQCKTYIPSFQEVFNNWISFSHLNNVDNAIPEEMAAWSYDSANDTISNSVNTSSYVGYVNPTTSSNYDVTVRVYSTNADDDTLGLVAAFATDANGKQHTLSFCRSPWNNSGICKWFCILDLCRYPPESTSGYGNIMLVNNSVTTPTPTSSAGWSSTTIGVGTVINIKRTGNIIQGKCSQFNSTTIDDSTVITIDLDELSKTYPLLNLFKGSSSWGYGALSQASSKFENIAISDSSFQICDLSNNKVWSYNGSTKTWNVVSGATPLTTIGSGRFAFNKQTNKLFYNTGSDIIEITSTLVNDILALQVAVSNLENVGIISLASSGTVSLSTNKLYKTTLAGNITFSLPAVSDNTKHNQIKIYLYMSTVRTITLGTSHYINGDAPDLSTAGNYMIYYDYLPTINAWSVGAMKIS